MSIWNDDRRYGTDDERREWRQDVNSEYAREAYYDKEAEKECCGNCRWHTKEALTDEWMCDCEDSDNCMDYTEHTDGCECFERR